MFSVIESTNDCDLNHICAIRLRRDSPNPVFWIATLREGSPTRAVRIVVQHTKIEKGWTYRLVVYEDGLTHRPVDCQTLGELVEVIRRVEPNFSEDSLAIQSDADRSYVAFSADWKLSDDQVSRFGLNRSD